MFKNIGEKIKTLAKLVFVMVSAISVIAGIVLGTSISGLFLFIIIVGPVSAWIFSWFLYGFGEIITQLKILAGTQETDEPEKSRKEKKTADRASKQKETEPEVEPEDEPEEDEEYVIPQLVCPKCGTQHDYDYPRCPKCKYEYR